MKPGQVALSTSSSSSSPAQALFDMKIIYLTKGQTAIVDDADYGELYRFKWFASKSAGDYYAKRWTRKNEAKTKLIYMHRWIMKCPDDKQVHHKDGDTLNNQRANLEICTKTENLNKRIYRKD